MPVARFRALALAGALLAPLSLAATRPHAQGDLLDRAVAAWSKVKTARATFEQTITNSLTGRTLTASGEYQQQRPGKISVRFGEPANDRIVADGTHEGLLATNPSYREVLARAEAEELRADDDEGDDEDLSAGLRDVTS